MTATQFESCKKSWLAEIGRLKRKMARASIRIEAQSRARKKLERERNVLLQERATLLQIIEEAALSVEVGQ